VHEANEKEEDERFGRAMHDGFSIGKSSVSRE
jgi:hypothetical protein